MSCRNSDNNTGTFHYIATYQALKFKLRTWIAPLLRALINDWPVIHTKISVLLHGYIKFHNDAIEMNWNASKCKMVA